MYQPRPSSPNSRGGDRDPDAARNSPHKPLLTHIALNMPGGSGDTSTSASTSYTPSAPLAVPLNMTNRRASYFSNNVFVPLGIRKLNAMYGPNGEPSDSGGSGKPGLGGGGSGSRNDLSGGSNNNLNGGADGQSILPFKLPPNFGSHVQLFAGAGAAGLGGDDDEVAGKSLVVRKKEIYAQLALIFGTILLGFVVYDYVSLLAYRVVSSLRPWLMSIQILHVASFYLFLLSFIYANEAGDLRTLKKSLVAFVINLTAFLARVTFDVLYADYMNS
ncbi:hypothetical protein BCR44DRAFT_78663 [Catenaria anguillulae PL171]|uniref:Uncharacterized protein n=1 Tax=Catenaria anguillulae PL171 TaxID=765915 RepID=A0A1Y2HCX5_9FUNG|nr:hypothetical protein BCR44DRAFT_78663 [Catenaria anguillulae PL171]